MRYDWILFDADETLFSFDDFQGLKIMFAEYGVDFTRDDHVEYKNRNKPLWVQYQNGEITAQELKVTRYQHWADKLKVDPSELNNAFLNAMADVCQPLKHVDTVVPLLAEKAKLGIVTNGFTELQQIRLERTGMKPFFQHVFISEEIGVAKPDPKIFEHALEVMGKPDRAKVLMVGDNPHSDVLGGMNAGIDTCWLNLNGECLPDGIKPTFTVSSWNELQDRLLG
ncbi:noncanonical pyrimidine nucleotidase, YjjG family [Veronia nyctiphanis]|uniref:Noncanonical pyrimidine nucleotidase, YjjG family n=1 Tax=Veronia nyctiphanis TaxID=1278244 RepID=A0A4V1LSA8_9GAMM|nr:pyrimidine 5'-nucleotidase [Veronia nyctiphanis]RXJ71048.1 noncanonical pyrimidine nucleotidase, YjjG family [Veronia nyctiphanis]